MTDEFQPSKDIKPWMVCAANRNKITGLIICGARHWDKIMRNQLVGKRISRADWEQGFIDQFGRFYNRENAMKAVKRSGQPFNMERNGQQAQQLYSEGLY